MIKNCGYNVCFKILRIFAQNFVVKDGEGDFEKEQNLKQEILPLLRRR